MVGHHGSKEHHVEVGVSGVGRGPIRACVTVGGGGRGLASQVGMMMSVVLGLVEVLVKVWVMVMVER